MAKLTNKHKGDLGLPSGIVLAPGQSIEVEDESIDNDMTHVVVKGWVDDGKLVVGDYEPPTDEEPDTPADGLDKLTKADLIEEADKLDLEFDEKKVTKQQLIDMIREAKAVPPTA